MRKYDPEEDSLSSTVVTVNAFGLWQMILKAKTMEVEAKGRTLRDLIDTLNAKTFGELERRVLSANRGLDPKFRIFVNGVARDDLDTAISNGDDVLLYSVIDGG